MNVIQSTIGRSRMIGRVWLVAASSALTCGALGSGDHSTSTCSLKSFFFSLGKSGQKYQNKFSCFSWRPAIISSTTKKNTFFTGKKFIRPQERLFIPSAGKLENIRNKCTPLDLQFLNIEKAASFACYFHQRPTHLFV